MPKRRTKKPVAVEVTRHRSAKRLNIPTAEHEPFVSEGDREPRPVRYQRNTDLDPQLVWRGKDEQDRSHLEVPAPPLYIQEKVEPKVLVDDLLRETKTRRAEESPPQPSLFGDFNGLPEGAERTEFYRHQGNWSNRMILGDSLRVMASLAAREGLRGKVQCIYLDPPYGIRFRSNFQWSTTSLTVTDGKREHISREPEQISAYRDTWRDGIHTYLAYLRDRLTVARDLLADTGSVFVQIGDENVHLVRTLMDEVFSPACFVSAITFTKTEGLTRTGFSNVSDYILWFSKTDHPKYRDLKAPKRPGQPGATGYVLLEDEDKADWRSATKDEISRGSVEGYRFFDGQPLVSQDAAKDSPYLYRGKTFVPPRGRHWTTGQDLSRIRRVERAERLLDFEKRIEWKRFIDETSGTSLNNVWIGMGERGFAGDPKIYVVQTATDVVERCLLMTTDPGDLVLDPTCGSGTTAFVAERWGRRWITIDTSRVALALARSRVMGGRYPYYILADSTEGQHAEAELGGVVSKSNPTYGDIRHGFVYRRVPHITLGAIANNTEIDTIWEQRQPAVAAALADLNRSLNGHAIPLPITRGARKGQSVDFAAPAAAVTLPSGDEAPANGLLEWEVPREPPDDWQPEARSALERFWDARITRQREIDESIARKADYETLYDKPVEDSSRVRVAGPFTVESDTPHRTLAVDEAGELIPRTAEPRAPYGAGPAGSGRPGGFTEMVLENLRAAGVQQPRRRDRIEFSSIEPWAGTYIAAQGRYPQGERERRAAIFIGPEFGTVSRADLATAAREAAEAGFHVLVACAFAYDAQAGDLANLGSLQILKARMNADLHMGEELKKTGKGNLFVIFGEPDIEIESAGDDRLRVRLNGVDVFHPQTGAVRSDSADNIPCWFIDTAYDGESFFVRHAYFPGAASDPYRSLKTTLKAEIDPEAWESLRRDVSRPFPKPASGRIAVKVINHLGDEVMKVFRV